MEDYIEDKSHHCIVGDFAATSIRQAMKSIQYHTCTKFKKSENFSSKSAIVFSRVGKRYMYLCIK